MSSLSPNERLKQIRAHLGISTREVAELSQKIAETEGNPQFYISCGWLTQLENSSSVPGLHKLYSLSVIYRMNTTELFLIFGVDLAKSYQHQISSPLSRTHLASFCEPDTRGTVTFPARFDPAVDLRSTNLLSRMVQLWGQVPFGFLRSLDLRNTMYGFIGLEDYMLYPVLRPGSFVQIDPQLRKVQPRGWRTEYERPIYFVELRNGYKCAWCEIQGQDLWLIPHPLSHCPVRRIIPGVDGEIIGQVTAAALRFTQFPEGCQNLPARAAGKP